ncbi:uncharacterized protein DEA37_0000045 [Paragonimus westermani]|uniref:Uncharacterized protein n=1 Tax=Paragonimus westermani TaxID=34504 RepID=A0A5J4NM61_9TREM|nr:uncharacterized protein DEA37_0000045 [Paragonimus westermani]
MAEFIRKIHGAANELQRKHMALLEATDKMKSEQSSCLQSAKHCRTYIQFLLKEIAKPSSISYDEFRDQFMLFSLYLNIVHCIQYQYQVGCLYKLHALGQRHPMDITVDGFMSWMFRRMTFTLPFLFGAYIFELYNAYSLYYISRQPYCHEWQAYLCTSERLIFTFLRSPNRYELGFGGGNHFFHSSFREYNHSVHGDSSKVVSFLTNGTKMDSF